MAWYPLFFALKFHLKHEIREKIREGIPEKDLVRISFSAGEIPDWEQEGKEFRKNGIMYDVVRIRDSADCMIVYCIADDEETALHSTIHSLLTRQIQDDRSPAGSPVNAFSKILSQVYINSAELLVSNQGQALPSEFIYSFSAVEFAGILNTPPPECCSGCS